MVWDIEADGLWHEVTKVHCIAVRDVDSDYCELFTPDRIEEGLKKLDEADVLIAHNGIGYDHPVLVKLHNWRPRREVKIVDTEVYTRTAFSDQKDKDLNHKSIRIQALQGAHSLEAWGLRLGCPKTDYQGGWETYNDAMGQYCLDDTNTGLTIYQHCLKHPVADNVLGIEQRTKFEYERMSRRGFKLNHEKAEKLSDELQARLDVIQEQVNAVIPPHEEEMATPLYWEMQWEDEQGEIHQHREETKGLLDSWRKSRKIQPKKHKVVLTPGTKKVKYHQFNANSTKQRRDFLVGKYGWVPPRLTDKGNELLKKGHNYEELAKEYGKTDEDTLKSLDWPEAKIFADAVLVNKIRSMAVSGDKSWLSQVRDGRVHARFIHIGTVTHRGACTGPNLQQAPHVISKDDEPVWGFEGRYGADCRDLFEATEGLILVGSDLSAIEARMQGHYLAPYDRGAFIDQLLNGDIHSANVDAFKRIAGYDIGRSDSKTCTYAFLYGAGDEKLGRIATSVSPEARSEWESALAYFRREQNEQKAQFLAYKQIGGRIRECYERGTVGMERLVADVKAKAKNTGYLSPIDGRKIPVRSEHSALNTLFQGAAAILFKYWLADVANEVLKRGLEAYPLAAVHDEQQWETLPTQADILMNITEESAPRVGKRFNIYCPLAAEAKKGCTWFQTH